MKEIDIDNWKRKEHFDFFRRSDLPFYNVNTNVDITGLRELAKLKSFSLNSILIYLTVRSMNQIENFRYRLHGESVILHDSLSPSFAHIGKGEELFRLITIDFDDDLAQFDRKAKKAIEESKSFFDLSMMLGRDDFVFISSLPWVTFTSIDHTLSLKKDDTILRASWGKYFESRGRILLPYNIQVNHVFVDGIHVGRFFNELETQIENIRDFV